MKKMILDNRRITVREVADDVGISFDSCKAILRDVLAIKCAAAKIVLKLLNFEQKLRRIDIAQEMLMTFNDDPDLLKKIITGGELWVYDYDIEPKVQSMEASRRDKAEKNTSSSVKCEGFAKCFLRLQRSYG